MCLETIRKLKPAVIGLLQALGVSLYCVLVAMFFKIMEKVATGQPGILAMVLILLLLVFSAAVSGLLIFGWPVYLVLHKKTKEALRILGYTFLFCFAILVVIIGIVLLFG